MERRDRDKEDCVEEEGGEDLAIAASRQFKRSLDKGAVAMLRFVTEDLAVPEPDDHHETLRWTQARAEYFVEFVTELLVSLDSRSLANAEIVRQEKIVNKTIVRMCQHMDIRGVAASKPLPLGKYDDEEDTDEEEYGGGVRSIGRGRAANSRSTLTATVGLFERLGKHCLPTCSRDFARPTTSITSRYGILSSIVSGVLRKLIRECIGREDLARSYKSWRALFTAYSDSGAIVKLLTAPKSRVRAGYTDAVSTIRMIHRLLYDAIATEYKRISTAAFGAANFATFESLYGGYYKYAVKPGLDDEDSDDDDDDLDIDASIPRA